MLFQPKFGKSGVDWKPFKVDTGPPLHPVPKRSPEVHDDLRGDHNRVVRVSLEDGEEEEMFIEGDQGPLFLNNGKVQYGETGDGRYGPPGPNFHGHGKHWSEMSPSERSNWLIASARRQHCIRQRMNATPADCSRYIRSQINWGSTTALPSDSQLSMTIYVTARDLGELLTGCPGWMRPWANQIFGAIFSKQAVGVRPTLEDVSEIMRAIPDLRKHKQEKDKTDVELLKMMGFELSS